MTIEISDLSIQMADQVTEMLGSVRIGGEDNDDCFNVVVEEKAIIVICMQNLNLAWRAKDMDLDAKLATDLAPLLLSLRGEKREVMVDFQIKCAEPGFAFINIETDKEDIILPVAQKIMEYIEEVL